MEKSKLLTIAFEYFDKINSKDPNSEVYNGETYPKEVLYAKRMTDKLNEFASNASEVVKLAARCQHICRWEIARNSYPMDRVGYLKWRQDLKKFHAKKASEILTDVGYSKEVIEKVSFLLEKKQLKKDKETQLLEDVACLVFIEHYFEPFSKKYSEDKLIDIVQKTWKKMSHEGREAALKSPLSTSALALISKALMG